MTDFKKLSTNFQDKTPEQLVNELAEYQGQYQGEETEEFDDIGRYKISLNCPTCKGWGNVHPMKNGKVDYSVVVACSCRKDAIEKQNQQRLLKYCGLPKGAENMALEKFEVFPELKTAFTVAKSVADNVGKFAWVTFVGNNGVGKTRLAIGICHAWLKAGIGAKYVMTPILLDELREGYSREGDDSYSEKFKLYCEVPLLVMDDLGTQNSTSWVNEKLETLIDYRMMNEKSLIVTSQLSLDEMTSRIRSRLIRPPVKKIVDIKAIEYVGRKRGK